MFHVVMFHMPPAFMLLKEEKKKFNICLNGPMLKVMFCKNQMQRQRQYT